MPTKKSSWPQFTGMESLQWQLYADGTPAGYLDLGGSAVEQEFFIGEGIEPRVEVRGVPPATDAVEATIEDVGGGSGNGGGE